MKKKVPEKYQKENFLKTEKEEHGSQKSSKSVDRIYSVHGSREFFRSFIITGTVIVGKVVTEEAFAVADAFSTFIMLSVQDVSF